MRDLEGAVDGGQARLRLQFARDWFERAWPNHYHDRLRADWDAYRASDAIHPEDIERHRPWMDRFRELARDPHLDPWNREALDSLLHDYDTAWPRERRRCVEMVRRWNDLVQGHAHLLQSSPRPVCRNEASRIDWLA